MAFIYRLVGCSIGLFVLGNTALAQLSITGTIQDTSNLPILQATLELRPLQATASVHRAYSADGHFKFDGLSKGTYVFHITHTGYKNREIYFQLNKDTAMEILMNPFVEELGAVRVIARKQLLEKKPDRTIFNVSSSVTSQGGNALSAIAQIPGVKVSGAEVSIVGKGAVRIMVNGKLVNISEKNLARYLASYASNNIEKIEVITSPSARYDADGNAGLINIITKQSNKTGWNGSLQANYKYANTFHNGGVTGDLHYHKDKWTLFGNVNVAGWKELMGWVIGVEYPNRSWSLNDTGIYRAENYNGTFGLDYQLSPNTAIGAVYSTGYLNYRGYDDVKNYLVGKPSGVQDSIVRSFAVYAPAALNNSVNVHLLTKLDSNGKQLSVDADYFNYYRTDYSDFKGWTQVAAIHAPDIYAPEQSLTKYYNTAKQNIRVYTLKADLTLPTPFANLALGTKLSFINNYSNALYYNVITGDTIYDNSKSNKYAYIENTQAFYIDGNKKMGAWSLQAGLRAEMTHTTGHSYTLNQEHKNNYFKLYPSALISWEASEVHNFSASFSKRIERPSFWTLNPYRSLLTSFAYYDGNPALKPAYTKQIELTHNYKKILSSSVYYSHTNNGFDNLTIGSPDTSLVYRTPLNFLKIKKVGLTEILHFSPFSWWQSTNQLNIYYTHAQSDLAIVNDIDGWGKYIATSNNFYLNKQKTFSGAVNFWCQYPEVDHIGMSNTYSSLDLGLMYSSANKKWNLAVNATDIFNNSAPTIYTTVNGLKQSFDNFQLSRSVVVALTYKFGNNQIKNALRVLGNEAEKSRLD